MKANSELGTHDEFRNVTDWDPDTAVSWANALEMRANAPEQQKLRQILLGLAQAQKGDMVVEIGCGTGMLLCDLATAVGSTGYVVGIEPQPVLAEAARQKLAEKGFNSFTEVRSERAERLSIPDHVVSACLAQTVLIHLPGDVLDQCFREMVRVLEPGGRVVSADQDGDTWIIDHPDRELTRSIVRFNSDQRYADGWTGRRLLRKFRESSLHDVKIESFLHVDVSRSSYLFAMAERIALAAAEADVISYDDATKWVNGLHELGAQGHFFSSINYYVAVGVWN